jgi:Uri superfamily endonuclease
MKRCRAIQEIRRTDRWVGAYVLHIRIHCPAQIRVGRFAGDRSIAIAQGDYVYIGSAMGKGDGIYLPRRIVRHATRSPGRPPHHFRKQLLAHFVQAGLSPAQVMPKSAKRLFWNIDYLLDHAAADVAHILYVRSETRLEIPIVERLEDRSDTHAPFTGLGAHDHRGHSHFLALSDATSAWTDCCQDVLEFIAALP